MAKAFPEPKHTKHQPDGDEQVGHIRSSRNAGVGHNDHERMPHPFDNPYQPNSPSGEGKGKKQ